MDTGGAQRYRRERAKTTPFGTSGSLGFLLFSRNSLDDTQLGTISVGWTEVVIRMGANRGLGLAPDRDYSVCLSAAPVLCGFLCGYGSFESASWIEGHIERDGVARIGETVSGDY